MREIGLIEGFKVFDSMELEKEKIAVILQEDIAQLVAIAKLRLVGSPEVALYLKEAVTKLASLAFEIKPQVLEDFGLLSALQELLNKRLSIHQYKIVLSSQIIEQLHPTIRVAIFRLVQLILNSPYRSVIGNFVLQGGNVVDYFCLKITFDIGFYSDALKIEMLEQMKLSTGSIVYLFNGHQIITTNEDQVALSIYIKLI
jgi:hypothetical protein